MTEGGLDHSLIISDLMGSILILVDTNLPVSRARLSPAFFLLVSNTLSGAELEVGETYPAYTNEKVAALNQLGFTGSL